MMIMIRIRFFLLERLESVEKRLEEMSQSSPQMGMNLAPIYRLLRVLGNAQSDFATKERIVWVDIEGACANELFVWSPSFKEVPEQELCSDNESIKANEEANNLNLGDENDSDVVSDTYFGDNGEDQGVEHHHGKPSKVKEVSA
ncbi:RNA-directed DNA polymerase, eukaryota, partial [Tanacetum coccineum]